MKIQKTVGLRTIVVWMNEWMFWICSCSFRKMQVLYQCPNLLKGRFQLENKLKMLISENEGFHHEINADQRHSSFSAHFQLVLDRTKPVPSFWRRKWKLPCHSVFTENEVKSFIFSLYPELTKLLAKYLQQQKTLVGSMWRKLKDLVACCHTFFIFINRADIQYLCTYTINIQ